MARRPFMPAPEATFRNRKGPVLSDRDLLRAWSRFTTEEIRQMAPDDDVKTRRQTRLIRERVIALREASEPEPGETVRSYAGGRA